MQCVDFRNDAAHITDELINLHISDTPTPEIQKTIDADMSILEQWKEVGVEYPGYYISNLGRLRGRKGEIFKGNPNSKGYVRCCIVKSCGKQVNRYTHILVAAAFIANSSNKPIVNHINGIRHDNRVVNLVWATDCENSGSMKLNQARADVRRRVIQFNIDGHPINVWDSVTDAGRAVSSAHTAISKACRDNSLCLGYQWRYYDDVVKPDNEEWKSIVYNGFTIQVSNLGRIRGVKGGIIGTETSDGYIDVTINGLHVMVHRLVCVAWKPIPNPEQYFVNHIDNDGKNNRIDNLEWVTPAENNLHYRKYFMVRGGSGNSRPVKQLSKDGTTVIAVFASIREASIGTGIDGSSITKVCQSKSRSAGGFMWQYHDTSI